MTFSSDDTLLCGDVECVPDPLQELWHACGELSLSLPQIGASMVHGARACFDGTIDQAWLERFEAAVSQALADDS